MEIYLCNYVSCPAIVESAIRIYMCVCIYIILNLYSSFGGSMSEEKCRVYIAFRFFFFFNLKSFGNKVRGKLQLFILLSLQKEIEREIMTEEHVDGADPGTRILVADFC